MKTVVIGSGGQLGRDLVPLLTGEVVPWTRSDVELTDPAAIRSQLLALRPDVVINCAAYNLVDKAESDVETAFAVNALAPRQLAILCKELDATLVQFSTDYVFGLDATRRSAWLETDAPGPVSAYGLSKLTGEYWARLICPRHFVIRTCGLYGVWGTGGKGGNFVETMLRLASSGKKLTIVNDQHCTPSFTADVAAATVELLATGKYGLYHLTNAGSCTWHEFAQEIFSQSGLATEAAPITSAEYGALARRPAYSVLARNACASLGLAPLRSWREALADYLELRKRK